MARILTSSWIDAFLQYTDKTEIPRDYLQWAAISTIASSIKLNCYLWYRDIKFFPNQYIIFVGPPGIGKDEAINKVTPLVTEAKSVNYIKDWHTPQEILEEISDGWSSIQATFKPGMVGFTGSVNNDHTCCILVPELAVFLQQYDNMHSLLCAWWNQDKFDYKTKNRGKLTITDMSVNLLGGCVPDYVRSLGKDKLAPITGGFTARTIFVYATEKYQLLPDNFGRPTQTTTKLRQDLIHDLKHITENIRGELTFDAHAQKLWQQIYRTHNTRGTNDSDASTNFKARISSHIVKTAITISISESDSLVITESQLRRAIGLVENVRDKVDIVFRSVGESTLANSQHKLLSYLNGVPSATYKEILTHMHRDATEPEVLSILGLLVKIGLIVETVVAGKVIYESANQVTAKVPIGMAVGSP